MAIVSGILFLVLAPFIFLSFLSRDEPGSKFGPTVCSRCGVELRGWRSSGRKQVWYRVDENGKRVNFCARCKNK